MFTPGRSASARTRGSAEPAGWYANARQGRGTMHGAFTIASDPTVLEVLVGAGPALVAVLSAVLPGVAAAGGQQLPAFWVLWALMAIPGLAALTVRAVAIARRTAGEMTWVERALWATWDVPASRGVHAHPVQPALSRARRPRRGRPQRPPDSAASAASVARSSGSAETGEPVACTIQRSGVTRPNDATRSNSAPTLRPQLLLELEGDEVAERVAAGRGRTARSCASRCRAGPSPSRPAPARSTGSRCRAR